MRKIIVSLVFILSSVLSCYSSTSAKKYLMVTSMTDKLNEIVTESISFESWKETIDMEEVLAIVDVERAVIYDEKNDLVGLALTRSYSSYQGFNTIKGVLVFLNNKGWVLENIIKETANNTNFYILIYSKNA